MLTMFCLEFLSIKDNQSGLIIDGIGIDSTHIKISQFITSLQTSHQQVVFAQLVTSCQQVWNKAVNNL